MNQTKGHLNMRFSMRVTTSQELWLNLLFSIRFYCVCIFFAREQESTIYSASASVSF